MGDGVNIAARLEGAAKPGAIWEVLPEIGGQNLELTVRDLSARVLHHVKNRSPVLGAVAGAKHAADLMAPRAGALDDLLAGALRQGCLRASRAAEKKRGKQRANQAPGQGRLLQC